MANVYQIENLLQCSICLDRFQTPKVLSCQHTFCLICLQRTFNTQTRTLTCPTCRKVTLLKQGPDELANNLLLINLMDVQPVKAKCPSCQKVEKLTVCEHCNCTKCTDCNEKHINDIRQSTKAKLDELKNTNQNDLKVSINNSFKNVKTQICNELQRIRQQHDSILLTKQMDILKQLDAHEQTLLAHVENDLQSIVQSKLELIGINYHLESKSEPELLNLLAKLSDVDSRLVDKLTEHQAYINSIEISLQYDPDRLDQINQMCHNIQLNITHTNDDKSNQQTKLSFSSEEINLTLRTFLNQEYKCRISLDNTIYELKQIFGKQQNLDPNNITLTKTGNYFDQLEDNRTLKSYDCDQTTVLMICIRK
ncbi:unnamed protein product [Rotaria socialis]|uniref:RING-type domain-containing protein n=1 Tax=Rotaria socialis TaxID=392032 RepID=A0A817T2A2_9BILA|nr:unnamed protein product [Rotaria socialis]CAF3255183.1 unnamed protein product [Rotaria socialis]CAF3306456.1 unnamed protein product [Rotaria socialis]CAF3528470.1 unnamed protein product [Rotaria socialis]CAF3651285.1 unnamed protein product [Rotaria socialis]